MSRDVDVDELLYDLAQDLGRRGLSFSELRKHVADDAPPPSSAGEPLTVHMRLRIAHCDEEHVNALLVHASSFVELRGCGKLSYSDVARLALRRGIEELNAEVSYRNRRDAPDS